MQVSIRNDWFLLYLQVFQVWDQCTCPVRFPVLRVAEGKYRMGENKSLIFVRVRNFSSVPFDWLKLAGNIRILGISSDCQNKKTLGKYR